MARRRLSKRLDEFFTKLNVGDHGPDAWMAWLGNEPCLETPWIYDFWGAPYKTQSVVRRAMNELYSNESHRYPGNDDLGEMSSWYVFSARWACIPNCPAQTSWCSAAPCFQKPLSICKPVISPSPQMAPAKMRRYVQSLTVNGKTCNKPWLRFSDINHNGNLEYDLGSTPNTSWGAPRPMLPRLMMAGKLLRQLPNRKFQY